MSGAAAGAGSAGSVAEVGGGGSPSGPDRRAPARGVTASARELAHRIGVLWRFELAQALRPGALLWGIALAAFPGILLVSLRLLAAPAVEETGMIEIWMYALITTLVCLLGLLLTATSAIHSEIENRTWVYLAVRPGARVSALLGKYLFAVSWVGLIATISTLLVALLLPGVVSPAAVVRTIGLSLLACMGYGALYIAIGVVFLRIGMVVAIAYTILFEMVVGNLPAIVGNATFSYHLRALFLAGFPEDSPITLDGPFQMGGDPALLHFALIVAFTLGFLLLAGSVLRFREIAVGGAD